MQFRTYFIVTSVLTACIRSGAPNDDFVLHALKELCQAILSTFRSLEMHSKWGHKVCIRSVILGELDSFRNYKASLFFS